MVRRAAREEGTVNVVREHNEAGEGAEGAELLGAFVSLAVTAGMFYGAYYIGKTRGREEERHRREAAASNGAQRQAR